MRNDRRKNRRHGWLVMLMLAGCATQGEDATPNQSGDGETQEQAQGSEPDQGVDPKPEIKPELAGQLDPGPIFDPAIFMRLDGDMLERNLGQPVLKRREGPAQVWQYQSGDCVLHLFLYAEDATTDATFRVEHVDAKVRDAAREEGVEPADACAGPYGVEPTPMEVVPQDGD